MYFMNLYENELVHYGVKGMKWGAKRSKFLFKRTIRKSCLPYFFSFFAQKWVVVSLSEDEGKQLYEYLKEFFE